MQITNWDAMINTTLKLIAYFKMTSSCIRCGNVRYQTEIYQQSNNQKSKVRETKNGIKLNQIQSKKPKSSQLIGFQWRAIKNDKEISNENKSLPITPWVLTQKC